jgi:hypothetical protein
MTSAPSSAPSSDVDLFTDDVLADPYPHYAREPTSPGSRRSPY